MALGQRRAQTPSVADRLWSRGSHPRALTMPPRRRDPRGSSSATRGGAINNKLRLKRPNPGGARFVVIVLDWSVAGASSSLSDFRRSEALETDFDLWDLEGPATLQAGHDEACPSWFQRVQSPVGRRFRSLNRSASICTHWGTGFHVSNPRHSAIRHCTRACLPRPAQSMRA